jgi:hypothetical protein
MEQSLATLLEQKHLINQLDSFIYKAYLQREDIQSLLQLFKAEQTDAENLLNKLQSEKDVDKNMFAEYVKFREKFRDSERALFKKIFDFGVNESDK